MLIAPAVYGVITFFGIRVVFEATDGDVLNAILAFYAPWNDPGALENDPPIHIVVRSIDEVSSITDDDHPLVMDAILTMVRKGISISADGVARRGFCNYAADSAGTDAILDASTTVLLFLVAHAGRIPLHASAIMLNDTAIVLAGRSGSGKSTLALAGQRAGLAILSDDTIFVQTVPQFRVWSFATAIHVFEKDAPECVQAGMRFRSGRWKKVLPIAAPCFKADRAIPCLLTVGDRIALSSIDHAEAVTCLTGDPEPGYGFYGERSIAAVCALAREGAWRLSLSHDPDAAITVLVSAFRARAPSRKEAVS